MWRKSKIEHLPIIYKALGSILSPSLERKRKGKGKEERIDGWMEGKKEREK